MDNNKNLNEINNSEILKGKGIPDFNSITPEEIKINIPILLKNLNHEFKQLELLLEDYLAQKSELNWRKVMSPLHEINEKMRWSWGVVSHLNAVCNSDELRKAYSEQQPEVVRFINTTGQSKVLFDALNKLKNQKSNSLNNVQKRIIESEIRSMKNRGVGLNISLQNEFNLASERLAKLSTKFSNNILDSTKSWSLLLTKSEEIEGLPNRALEKFAKAAKDAGDIKLDKRNEPNSKDGPWRVGLDMPSYITFMTYASNRSLRETLYKAHISRASKGELDNQPLIEEILILRSQQAKRLGYKNWAELSLSNKMAKDIAEVESLLEELRSAAMPAAKQELLAIQKLANKERDNESFDLQPWDISYWSEKLKQEEFNLNQEVLREWFPLPQVLRGLFELTERLFEIKIKPADGNAPKWHEDVSFFEVLDKKDNSQLAFFYLDPYARPSTKRGGAWMDECLTREKSQSGEVTLPIAYLVCNQSPPIKKMPSLMSFDEVETLFHEFGHGLQHMLTTVNYPQAAGINNVEWDAVELPSQFMENWCLEHATLMGMAKHWKTEETLPEEEYKKLKRSKTFNSGISTLRQVHFALTDLHLHSHWNKDIGITPDQMRRQIAISTTIIPPIPEDNFLCSFGHIFSGGYSAGYYSYKWAEVLSADAFAAFEEAGENEELIKQIGKHFRKTILSLGGSHHPSKVFQMFRNRKPRTDALIRLSGLGIDH